MNQDPQHTAPTEAEQRQYCEQLEGAIALYLEGDIIAKVRLTNLTSSDSGIRAQVDLLHNFAPNPRSKLPKPTWHMSSTWQFAPTCDVWSMPYVGFKAYFDPELLARVEEHALGLSPELTPQDRYRSLRRFISDFFRPKPLSVREQIQADVEALAEPGGRAVGTEGHQFARVYLDSRLRRLKLKPYAGTSSRLLYAANGIPFTNLAALLPGTSPGASPLLVGAHYDTCGPTPGADDNAAAIAAVLAAVTHLQAKPLARDLIVAFFDAEEPPYFHQDCMGSTTFYRSQRTGPIDCAFILDLVGHDVPIPGLESLLFITGMESHSALEQVLLSAEVDPRIKIVAASNSYVGDMSDHHVFRLHDIPYLFFSCGRWQHYHAPTDTPDKLNYDKIEAIASSLADIIRSCDACQFPAAGRTYDSTPTELLLMNRTLGPFLQKQRLPQPRTRADLDEIAATLLSQFRL